MIDSTVIKEFENYLKTQTNLSTLSIKLYVRYLRHFLLKYKEPTVENMNLAIKENPGKKACFKHFLTFLGRVNDYKMLIKTKPKPKLKEGIYLSKEELKQIVFSIPDETYRIVALLQYCTGLRASDVLRIEKDKIELLDDGSLRIFITLKGGHQSVAFIPTLYSRTIYNFVQRRGKFPFLKGESSDFSTWVTNNYTNYYRILRETAERLGYPDFRSHDFRRSFIDEVYTKVKDIREARVLAHHVKFETSLKYIQKKADESKIKELINEFRNY